MKKERIKIKCPLCKSKVPSNALKCAKCAGDLNTEEAQKNIQSQLHKQRKLKMATAIIFSFLIIIIIASSGEEDAPTQQVETLSILTIGDDGILNNQEEKTNCEGNTILGTSKETYDEFSKAQVADDKLDYLQMLGDGKIFLIPNCTKVKVIDSSFTLKKVRILEGEHLGVSGWMPFEFVVK